jgi:translocation and assembly module TamA
MKLKSIKIFLLSSLFFIYSNCFANKNIIIKGVDYEIERNIRSYLSTIQLDCQATDGQLDAYKVNLPLKVKKSIQPFGYYSSLIEFNILPRSKDCWKIVLTIDLGKPVIIDDIQFKITGEGITNQQYQKLRQQFSMQEGNLLVSSVYEQYKTSLVDLASELGYLDANFIENKIDVYPDKYKADVSLHFDTGIRYTINNVKLIQTPEFLNEEFLTKLISLKQGNFFTNSQLYNLKKKLAATGYFEQVSIDVDYTHRIDGSVPVKIILTPGDRIRYSVGLGFSTDSGPRVSIDHKQDRVTDYGYQLNTKMSTSKILSEFSTGIKMPSKSNPIFKWYNIEAGFRKERTNSASSDTSKLGLSQTRVQDNKWQNINYIDLVNEKFDTGDNRNESLLFIPGASWSFTKADNPRLPMKGFKIQAEIKGASESIISDVSFAQINISLKSIYPIGTQNRLIYRGKLGSTLIDELSLLPSSYRFYTGGDNSIRGFNYNTLSPKNTDGDAIGGKHLFLSSLEYEHRIGNHWAFALFADTGNAFNEDIKLEKSIGAGLRWFSPIGPVRFDIGFPLKNERNDFQVHITVGPDF